MAVNQATLELIREFEGFVPTWYRDPVGIWTVCYGHTDAAGEPKYADTKNKRFSEDEGLIILAHDLQQYERAVDKAVTVTLNANQRGALVSFTYNLGPGNLNKSTLLRKLNDGDYKGAAQEFARWNRAGGKVLNGLSRRRAAERMLFLTPVKEAPKPADKPEPETKKPTRGRDMSIIAVVLAALYAFAKSQGWVP